MSRPLRIEYPNAVYHVTSRGNARNKILLGDQNIDNFLSVQNAVVKRYNWPCHAYCLIDNHYHLLRTGKGDTAASEVCEQTATVQTTFHRGEDDHKK